MLSGLLPLVRRCLHSSLLTACLLQPAWSSLITASPPLLRRFSAHPASAPPVLPTRSIEFVSTLVDYVSCSPLRVPIARLAAAQAAIKAGMKVSWLWECMHRRS